MSSQAGSETTLEIDLQDAFRAIKEKQATVRSGNGHQSDTDTRSHGMVRIVLDPVSGHTIPYHKTNVNTDIDLGASSRPPASLTLQVSTIHPVTPRRRQQTGVVLLLRLDRVS
jgi:hypothetical protein